MDRVLSLDHRHHGRGCVLYSWHPSSLLLASVGTQAPMMMAASGGAGGGGGGAAGHHHHHHSHHTGGGGSGSHQSQQQQAQAAINTRSIWVWHMGGMGTKTHEGKERIGAAAVEQAVRTAASNAAATAAAAAASAAAAFAANTTAVKPLANSNGKASTAGTAASSSTAAPATSSSRSSSSSSATTPSVLSFALSDVSGYATTGEKLFQILPPNPAQCIGLEWDASGSTLAILQAAPAQEVLLWHLSTGELESVDLNLKEATFLRWNKTGAHLAIGTGRGEVLLYDRVARACWFAAARHKKRVTCGDWNREGKFAFASDDRQITICIGGGTSGNSNSNLPATTASSGDISSSTTAPTLLSLPPDGGKTFGQVKVKSKPTSVKFGGNDASNPDRENIVSVSMDRKTILLYNLDDPENALELAFQQRYGHIVSFKWFRDGYVMVGFSLGYLVVISTHLDEIGREQFCARFHADGLRDLSYSSAKHQVATVGDSTIKIVDMNQWKEVRTQDIFTTTANGNHTTNNQHLLTSMGAGGVPAEVHPSTASKSSSSSLASSFSSSSSSGNIPPAPLDKLSWSSDGRFVCVSTRSGCLFVYAADGQGAAGGQSGGRGGQLHDAASAAAARRRNWALREQEASQALGDRIVYKPLDASTMGGCAALVALATVVTMAHALGISLGDMWKLATCSFHV